MVVELHLRKNHDAHKQLQINTQIVLSYHTLAPTTAVTIAATTTNKTTTTTGQQFLFFIFYFLHSFSLPCMYVTPHKCNIMKSSEEWLVPLFYFVLCRDVWKHTLGEDLGRLEPKCTFLAVPYKGDDREHVYIVKRRYALPR